MKTAIIAILTVAAMAVGAQALMRPSGPALHVPRVAAPIVIDAELEGKRVWEADNGNTGDLKDEAGRGMVPYTEVKARWGQGKLYFMLYAGDLDIEKGDAFRLEIGGAGGVHVIEVSALGGLTEAACAGAATPALADCDRGWKSGAQVAVDRDGTVGQLGDNDEEWVVEMALPLAALGLDHAAAGTRIPFTARRCDAGAGARACGSWGARKGELVLD